MTLCRPAGARPARRDVGAVVGVLRGQREPGPRRARPEGAQRARGEGLCKETHSH